MDDIPGALADYDQAIALQKDNTEGLSYRGMLRLGEGNIKSAMDDFETAIALRPDLRSAYTGKIAALIALKRIPEAATLCNWLMAHFSDNPMNYICRARLYQAQGLLVSALEDYDRVVLLSNYKPYSTLERARFKAQMLKDYKGAMEDCNRLILLYPALRDAYLCRAQVESLINQPDQTINDCDTSIALGPREATGYFSRGMANYLNGNEKQAMKDIDTALSIDPKMPDIYVSKAAILLASGDTATAVKLLESYPLGNGRADSLVVFPLGVLKIISHQFASAKKYLEKAIALQPDSASRYYYCGIALDSLHDQKGACAMMLKAYKLGNDGSGAAFDFMKTFCPGTMTPAQVEAGEQLVKFEENFSRENYTAALASSDRIIAQMPDSSLGYFERGEAKRAMGNYEEAIKDYGQAMRISPSTPNAYIGTAIAYFYLKDMKSSREYYFTALKKDPANAGVYSNLGFMAKEEGNYKEAIRFFKNAVNYKYGNPDVWLFLGDCYKAINDKENACFAYRQALAQGKIFAKVEIMNLCK